MGIKYRKPKGTRDLMFLEMERWQWCENKWREVLSRFGYGEIRTPSFESTSLFTRSVGSGTDIVDKEMYTFDSKGGESLSLRPEATASVVRAYLENGLTRQPGTVKFYYMGPMFRYDRPQAGRYRQFHQVGVEAIGSESPILDAEVVRTATALFEAVGADDLTVQVNSIGCENCRPDYINELRSWAVSNKEEFCGTCVARTETNPLRLFDCKNEDCQQLLTKFKPISEALCDDCKSHHQQFCSSLEKMDVRFENDNSLVRGLDYYTRTTFEISAGSGLRQSALCGGGRYDYLVKQCGGPTTPAVGFSAGVERIVRYLYDQEYDHQRSRQSLVDVFVVCMNRSAQQFALQYADKLRLICKVEIDTTDRGVKAQMKAAVSREASIVLIVGDDEVSNNQFQMKIMGTGEQMPVGSKDIATAVQEVLNK
jgi:histidyl-tRNA synthetase